MTPLLSIVVPTKNRYEYLKQCIETIKSLDCDEIELVVQDNSLDNSWILDYLKSINYNNLKYFHTTQHISQSENCNLAIENSSGQYVCMLGDDDTVTEKIIDVVKWMRDNTIDSCLGSIVRYNWPDLIFKYHKYSSIIIPYAKPNILKLSLEKQLHKCLSKGAREMDQLPKVYHAVVSKKALDLLYKRTGTYFPGPSPDMANAIGLCFVLSNHFFVNVPIIISGFSYKSAGGQGTRGEHVGDIKSIAQLPVNTDELWESKIPKIWTAETIYAESVIKALRALDESLVLSKFNYINSYAALVCYHFRYRKLISSHMSGSFNYLKFVYYCFLIFCKRANNFFWNFLKTRFGWSRDKSYSNVPTLIEAADIVNEYNKSLNLNLILKNINSEIPD